MPFHPMNDSPGGADHVHCNLALIGTEFFTALITTLSPVKLQLVCVALSAATAC